MPYYHRIMKKRNINLCLYELSNWRQYGIGHYQYNIALGLHALNKYDIRGVTFRNKIERMPFKVIHHFLPYRYFFDSKTIASLCPIPYNWLCGDFKSDVNIFFWNKIPKVRITGNIIGVLHDLIPLRVTDCLLKGGMSKERVFKFYEEFERLVNRSTRVCTVSEFSKRDIVKEFSVPDDRIDVVPPGVDVERFSKRDHIASAAIRKKYDLPTEYMLYFGGLSMYKNVDNAIKAYSLLPVDVRKNFSFVISGFSERLEALARQYGVLGSDGGVRFLGYVPEQDKAPIYQMASAFVFVSRYEGFGMPIIEAMASGVPVLGSTCASIPEVIGTCGLTVDPDDVDGMSCKMNELLGNCDLRNRFVRGGLERAKLYSWHNSVEKMATCIDSTSSG